MKMSDLDLERLSGLPPPCPKCGYLTGVLSKIPPLIETYSPLIRSRYVPSAADRNAIANILSTDEASMRILEAELSKLQSAFVVIQTRLSNIRRHAERQRSLLSPIRQLPDELLVEIFFYVCEETVNVFRRAGGIWTLQQVCAYWRALAQNTPLLWSKVNATEYSEKYKPSAVARRIRSCLVFSRTVPLSVTLSVTKAAIANDSLHRAVKDIARHAHRWLYLSLCEAVGKILRDTTATTAVVPQGGGALLRTLRLTGIHDLTKYRFLRDAAILQDVQMCYGTFPNAFQFRWSNVRRLSVSRCHVGSSSAEYDFASLFKAMPLLEELDWRDNRDFAKLMPSPVTLEHLRVLKVHYSELIDVMPMLRVPRLETLQISDKFVDARPLLTMIRVSGCAVKHLRLHLEKPAPVLQILDKEFHSVERLSLSLTTANGGVSEILSKLMWRPKAAAVDEGSIGTTVLPSLRKLEVVPYENTHPVQLIDLLVDHLEEIMRSRSFAAAGAAEIQNTNLPSVPLSFLKCAAYVRKNQYAEYKDDFSSLEELGKELDVKVDLRLIPVET